MACEKCGQGGQTVCLSVGEQQQELQVCRHCFDVEMRRRLTMNLAAQEYRYSLQTWESLADDDIGREVEAQAEAVLVHLGATRRGGVVGYEAAKAFLGAVASTLPKEIVSYVSAMLIEITAQVDLLAIVAARLSTRTSKDIILSEIEQAFDAWEVDLGIKLAAHLRGFPQETTREERMAMVDKFVAIIRKRVRDSFAREVQCTPDRVQEDVDGEDTW